MKGDELPAEWQAKPVRKAANGKESISKRAQKKKAAAK
jgi:hypothetical protein